MAGQTVVISVLADTKAFASGMSGAAGSANSFGDSMKKVGAITAAVALAGAAALAGFLASSVKAAGEAEKIAAQTGAVLESTGGAAGKSAAQVGELANQLSKISGVDDEVIQSGENILLTFTKIKGTNFDKATQSALDMSVALGTDMKSASILVGKALNDPIKGITALTKSGVQFTEQQKDQIKAMTEAGDVAGAQTIILKELETQFGGSAAAFGDTFEGAIGKFKTAFGNLQELIGGALLPAFTAVTAQAAMFIDTITESAAFQSFIAGFTTFITGLVDGTTKFADIGAVIAGGIQNAADWLANGGVKIIVDALLSGREQLFAAGLVIFPALIESLIAVIPQIIAGVVTLVTQIVGMLVQSAPMLLTGAIHLFLGIIEGLGAVLPDIIKEIIGLVPVILDALLSSLPNLLGGAIELFTSLIDALVEIIPMLIQTIVELIPVIITSLVNMIPMLIEGAIQLFMAIVNAIPVIIPILIQAVVDLIPVLIQTIVDLIPLLLDAAIDLFLALVEAIPIIIPQVITAVINAIPLIISALINAIPKIIEAGIKLFGGLIEAVVKIAPALLTAGGQLIQGLWDGISKAWTGFMKWWNGTVKGVVDTVKSVFGIHSPSRVFADIGKNIVAGLEQGLAGPNSLDQIMAGLTDQVTGGVTVGSLSTPDGYRAAGGVHIVVNGGLDSGPAIGRSIVNALDEYRRSGGTVRLT